MELNEKLQQLVDELKSTHPGIGNKVKVAIAGQNLMTEILGALQAAPTEEGEAEKHKQKVEKITGKAELYEKLTKVSELTDKVIRGIDDLKAEDLEEEKSEAGDTAGGITARAIRKKSEINENTTNATTKAGQDIPANEERGN